MKKQILIIEDDNINIEILRAMLGEKYNTVVATTGKMALRITEIKKPDLILLDLGLPDINGFDVLSTIKQHSNDRVKNIPVLITTGDTEEASELKGLQLGAADYIFKPYNQEVLDVRIKNQLEILEYRDNLSGLVDEKTEELKGIYNTLIATMSLLIESRDNDTGEHISKVQQYIIALLNKIDKNYIKDVPHSDIDQIILYSPIHDIGKISISDSILLKAGALTKEEFDNMKRHTTLGGNILRKVKTLLGHRAADGIDFAIQMAESHHEKWDGTGYPSGLKEDEIPLSARLVSIADIYDALTGIRPYKTPFSHSQAYEIIINGDGRTKNSHFDPYILDAFIAAESDFKAILQSNKHFTVRRGDLLDRRK